MSTPTPTHSLTSADLEAWLDGLMPTALRNAQTPGAVVVVVKDGTVLGVITSRTILARLEDYVNTVSNTIARLQMPPF